MRWALAAAFCIAIVGICSGGALITAISFVGLTLAALAAEVITS